MQLFRQLRHLCSCPCFSLCNYSYSFSIYWDAHKHTHLWPISWATVKATGRPESSLMLQLRCGWHMPDRWDRPRVSQGWFIPAQMSFLEKKDLEKGQFNQKSSSTSDTYFRVNREFLFYHEKRLAIQNRACWLALWSALLRHDALGVCRSEGWGFSAKHRNWPMCCQHDGRSWALSA